MEEINRLSAVIVLAADEKYLPHARSTLVNCRRQGQWKQDFCLILPPEVDASYYTRRGIYVLPDPAPAHYRKFALFSDYFNQQYTTEYLTPEYRWDTVLYMDEDVLVQAPLEPLLHEVGWNMIVAEREMFTVEHAFTHWATPEQLASAQSQELFQWLRSRYDLQQPQYTTSVLLWHPRMVEPGDYDRLHTLAAKLAPINSHVQNGTDQPIINLAFAGKFERIRSDLFGYWRNCWDQSIVVHY